MQADAIQKMRRGNDNEGGSYCSVFGTEPDTRGRSLISSPVSSQYLRGVSDPPQPPILAPVCGTSPVEIELLNAGG